MYRGSICSRLGEEEEEEVVVGQVCVKRDLRRDLFWVCWGGVARTSGLRSSFVDPNGRYMNRELHLGVFFGAGGNDANQSNQRIR